MKRFSKRIGVLCGIALCAMMLFAVNDVNVYANEVETVEENIEGRSTNLQWFYTYIDGVKYMRLYNHNTGQWLTDWIPAVE